MPAADLPTPFRSARPRDGGAVPRSGGRQALSLAAVVCIALLPVATFAQDAPALRLRTLAAACATCHGTDGHAPVGSPIVSLAGRPQAELRATLDAFANGTRAGTVMPQIAKGYTAAQLDALAAYFASRPVEPAR